MACGDVPTAHEGAQEEIHTVTVVDVLGTHEISVKKLYCAACNHVYWPDPWSVYLFPATPVNKQSLYTGEFMELMHNLQIECPTLSAEAWFKAAGGSHYQWGQPVLANEGDTKLSAYRNLVPAALAFGHLLSTVNDPTFWGCTPLPDCPGTCSSTSQPVHGLAGDACLKVTIKRPQDDERRNPWFPLVQGGQSLLEHLQWESNLPQTKINKHTEAETAFIESNFKADTSVAARGNNAVTGVFVTVCRCGIPLVASAMPTNEMHAYARSHIVHLAKSGIQCKLYHYDIGSSFQTNMERFVTEVSASNTCMALCLPPYRALTRHTSVCVAAFGAIDIFRTQGDSQQGARSGGVQWTLS